MKDWIEHRLNVLRSDKTLDLYDLLEKKRLQSLQEPVNNLQYAKVVKNMMSSPTKLASYRPKTENE